MLLTVLALDKRVSRKFVPCAILHPNTPDFEIRGYKIRQKHSNNVRTARKTHIKDRTHTTTFPVISHLKRLVRKKCIKITGGL